MSVVTLDSHVFIWGMKRQATDGQEEKVPEAVGFLRKLDAKDAIVVVPSVVLYELLMPIPPGKRNLFLSRFQTGFLVAPLDVAAARHAAEVWHAKKDEGVLQRVREDFDASRDAIKADTLIIGTAIATGSSCIYSHDAPLAALAEGFIDVKPMDYTLDIFERQEVDQLIRAKRIAREAEDARIAAEMAAQTKDGPVKRKATVSVGLPEPEAPVDRVAPAASEEPPADREA